MKVKRIHLYLSALLLIACSCEKTRPDEAVGLPIRFDNAEVMVETLTRNTSQINRNLPAGAEFGVYGYCIPYIQNTKVEDIASAPVSWSIKKQMAHADIFCNQKVTVNAQGTGCFYPNLKYWYRDLGAHHNTQDYKYTFFGYYPYEIPAGGGSLVIGRPSGPGEIALPQLTYTLPYQGKDVKAQLDDRQVPDLLYASAIDTYRKTGSVQLQFHHVFTAIRVRFRNYNQNKHIKIKNLRAQCDNLYRQVSLDFREAEDPAKFMTIHQNERFSGFIPLMAPGEVVDLQLAPGTEKTEYNTRECILLLSDVAQTNSFGGVVTILFDISGTDFNAPGYPFPDDFKPYPGIQLRSEFMAHPGIEYTLELNFVDKDFVINVIAENSEIWQDGGDSDMEIG